VAAHAGDPAYLLLAARIATAEKNAARAESSLRAILDKDSAREDATLLYASILVPQGRVKDAQAALEKSLEKIPASVPLRLGLGDLLERQSLFAEARAQYERIIADNQIAGGTTEMLNAQQMGSARLARLFANQGTNLDEALLLASSAMRYKPKDPGFADILGWVHTRKQRARLGLPYLETALKADPANPLVRYHLGVAYDQLGEIQKARLELVEALRLDPGFNGADAARTLLKALGR
jgi:Flp pilus assembly protein TadD